MLPDKKNQSYVNKYNIILNNIRQGWKKKLKLGQQEKKQLFILKIYKVDGNLSLHADTDQG